MRVEIIDTLEGLGRIKPQWDAFLAQTGMDSPFMTIEWFLTCARSHNGDNKLLVSVVRDKNEIVAIAPFVRMRTTLRGIPARAIMLIGDYYSDWTEIMLLRNERECLKTLFEHLSALFPRDMFFLRSIIKGSRTDTLLKAMMVEQKARFVGHRGGASPYIPITGPWEEYYQSRSKNVRHKLNRIGNMFEREKQYEIVMYTRDDVDRAMSEIIAIDKKTWQYAEGSSLTGNPRGAGFYADLAHSMAPHGRLAIWILKLHGKPIAFQYALRYNNKLYGLKTGFDAEYMKMAPGKFLIKNIVRYCHENGFAEFNLLGKDESYKMELTSYRREHVKYYIYCNTIKGKMMYFLETMVIPFLKQMAAGMKPKPQISLDPTDSKA